MRPATPILAALLTAACGAIETTAPTAPEPAPGGPRTVLTQAELESSPEYRNLVSNGHFMPIGDVGPPRHRLEGTLVVPEASWSGPEYETGYRRFPGFAVEFVLEGDALVPVSRGILRRGRDSASFWEIILSPGRAWSEAGDAGRSRASFPFVLVGRAFNQAHNGVATFVFDDRQVSALRVQVMQETASWSKHDFWGQLEMTYTPGASAATDGARRKFADEKTRTRRAWTTGAARGAPPPSCPRRSRSATTRGDRAGSSATTPATPTCSAPRCSRS